MFQPLLLGRGTHSIHSALGKTWMEFNHSCTVSMMQALRRWLRSGLVEDMQSVWIDNSTPPACRSNSNRTKTHSKRRKLCLNHTVWVNSLLKRLTRVCKCSSHPKDLLSGRCRITKETVKRPLWPTSGWRKSRRNKVTYWPLSRRRAQ